jgi:hypothetical protein
MESSGSAPASGAADDALVVGIVRHCGFAIRELHHFRVRREGAPNYSRGGCAPNPFFSQAIRTFIRVPSSATITA